MIFTDLSYFRWISLYHRLDWLAGVLEELNILKDLIDGQRTNVLHLAQGPYRWTED